MATCVLMMASQNSKRKDSKMTHGPDDNEKILREVLKGIGIIIICLLIIVGTAFVLTHKNLPSITALPH